MGKRLRQQKHPCCQVRVAWKKKPVAYLQQPQFDDFLYFIQRFKTVYSVLKAEKEIGIILSPEVMDTYKKLVKEGVGNIPYSLWRVWSADLEKERKRAQKIEAENPEEPPEPVDDFLGILGERESKELDIGFKVYRLVDADGRQEIVSDINKHLDKQQEECERQINEKIPRLLSDVFTRKEIQILREYCVRAQYDKEFAAEFEKQFKL